MKTFLIFLIGTWVGVVATMFWNAIASANHSPEEEDNGDRKGCGSY